MKYLLIISLLAVSAWGACAAPPCSLNSPTTAIQGIYGTGAPYNALASSPMRWEFPPINGTTLTTNGNQWFAQLNSTNTVNLMTLQYSGGMLYATTSNDTVSGGGVPVAIVASATYLIELPAGTAMKEAEKQMRAHSGVQYVNENATMRTFQIKKNGPQ